MKPLTKGQRKHLLRLTRRTRMAARLAEVWRNTLVRTEEGYFEVRDLTSLRAAKYKQ